MSEFKAMSLADLAIVEEAFGQVLTQCEKELGKCHSIESRTAKTKEIDSWRESWKEVKDEINQRANDIHVRLRGGQS